VVKKSTETRKICTFERHAIKKVKKARFLTLTIVMENKYLIKIIKYRRIKDKN